MKNWEPLVSRSGIGQRDRPDRVGRVRRDLGGEAVSGSAVALPGGIPALQDVQLLADGEPVAVGVVVEALRGQRQERVHPAWRERPVRLTGTS